MIFSLNAGSARLQSFNNLTVFTEISEIVKNILLETQNGGVEVIVKNTPMTFSRPKILITAIITNPTIEVSDTLNLNGTNIVLGTSGTNLNSIISDINDANIEGLLASKRDNKLVLEYISPENNWQFVIGEGTANNKVGISSQIYTPENPLSVSYYGVWAEIVVDRRYKSEMDMIIKYFEKLGYVIYRKTNPNTSNTFEWVIQW